MKKGFTLLELMIVIVILGVLAALISGNFITSLQKGRDAQRKADLEHIQRALELYYEDKKAYPIFNIFATSNLQLCESGIANNCGSEKTYMEKIPNNPDTKTSYKYYYTTGQSYGLYACLENTQQILPYLSTSSNYGANNTPALTCGTTCKKASDGSSTPCVWGLSDTNSTP